MPAQLPRVRVGVMRVQAVLIVVVGAGLLGCFVPTLRAGLSGRAGNHAGRRLYRPKSLQVGREPA